MLRDDRPQPRAGRGQPDGASAGDTEETRVARWMEQAGAHQTRAHASLRRARDPSAGPLAPPQRRQFLVRALEHILSARRLLERARGETHDPELLSILEEHLARLATTAASIERRLHELDAAER